MNYEEQLERNVSLFKKEFNSFLSEMVSISNYKDTLYIDTLSEAQKFTVSDKLIAALYKSSMEKYQYIDFGKIPDSKGDFDRITHINEINETLDVLKQMIPLDNKELSTLLKTIETLRTYKKEFVLGFMQDVPLIVMTYNITVLSVFTLMSICMKICIDYLRTPNGSIEISQKIIANANNQYTVVMDSLSNFNKAAQKGDLKKLFDNYLKKENFIGSGLGIGLGVGAVSATAIAGVATLTLTFAIIPTIRELLYFHYNVRMMISDFFKRQAAFLEINVAELRNAGGNAKVIKRQEQKIKQFEKLSNKFDIDCRTANVKTKKELSAKVSTNDIQGALVTDKDDISSFNLL